MPPSQWQTYKQTKWSGENKIPALEQLQPDQLLVAYNTVATPDGTLQTRKGKTLLNAVSLGTGPVRGLWRFVKSNGNAYLVALHGTTLYAGTWAGGTASVTFASIKTGLDATAQLRGVVWRDKLILTNGVQNPFTYDGSAVADLSGSPPKSEFIKVYSNRLFLVDVANPNQLRWSGLENEASWDALDLINVRTNDGDKITGIAALAGGLVIFKRNSCWTLYGSNRDDFQLVQTSSSIGALASDSIIDGGIMFSADNIWRFNLSDLGEMPQTHKVLFSTLTMAQKKAIKAVSIPDEKRVIVELAGLTLNLELTTGGITTWTGLNIGAMTAAEGGIDDGSLLIGDKTNGYVYALNNDTDDAGTAINTELWTPYLDMGSTREKVWRVYVPELSVIGSSGTITLKYDVDRGKKRDIYQTAGNYADLLAWDSGDNWNTSSWGPLESVIRWPMHNARGLRASFRISTTARIKLEGMKFQFRETGKLL